MANRGFVSIARPAFNRGQTNSQTCSSLFAENTLITRQYCKPVGRRRRTLLPFRLDVCEGERLRPEFAEPDADAESLVRRRLEKQQPLANSLRLNHTSLEGEPFGLVPRLNLIRLTQFSERNSLCGFGQNRFSQPAVRGDHKIHRFVRREYPVCAAGFVGRCELRWIEIHRA